MEHWIEIDEAPRYLVSSAGRVQNRMTGLILKPALAGKGYAYVRIMIDGKPQNRYVHRLMADAFYSGDYKHLQVNHDDGVKVNNQIWNLEWSTPLSNTRHAIRTGLSNLGERPVRIVETGECFDSLMSCARAINGSQANITACLKGRRRSHRGYTFEFVD